MKKKIDFLGVGFSKCASTWIHDILSSHPDIAMPTKRKEVGWFKKEYDNKSFDWYLNYFDKKDLDNSKIIGEFNPHYSKLEEINLKRINKHLQSKKKFIFIFRNPWERLKSSFLFSIQSKNHNMTFKERINLNKFKKGMYSPRVKEWLEEFQEDQYLFLVFENIVKNKEKLLQDLADFLNVDVEKFNEEILSKKSNPTYKPRFHFIYSFFRKIARKLRDYSFDSFVNLTRKTRIEKIFETNKKPEMKYNKDDFPKLIKYFKKDTKRLEELTNKNITDIWSF
ncbi:MAG: sulfotransferase domain-containing protein [Candidatus Woesearchaeota archaeon]